MLIEFCIWNISFDVSIKIITVILGIISIFLAITGYRKFLKNQLVSKQLDVVCELIKQIQQSDWHYFKFHNTKDENKSRPFLGTLFDIAEMEDFNTDAKLCFWCIDSLTPTEDKLHSWDFFMKFYSHPFLPKSIAEELKKFNLRKEQ